MADGGFTKAGGGGDLEAKITSNVMIDCIFTALAGLVFGYEIAVSDGVTSMPLFLKNFFPTVYRKTVELEEKGLDSNYCKYDNQGLQLYSSSLYMTGLIGALLASKSTRMLGRRPSMMIAAVLFSVGFVFNASGLNFFILLLGRIFLGFGVGFANQAVPLFLSEIGPSRKRASLNILFPLNVTIGILFANLVNSLNNWRLSLGLVGIPALFFIIAAIFVAETPISLIERGRYVEATGTLKFLRGTDKINHEFLELVEASRVAKEVKYPFRNLLERNRPQLVISIALQFTGINTIMFHAPVLFNMLGFKSHASLYSAVIIGAVNVISTTVSIYLVDKVGRRMLLLEAGCLMLLSQVVIAIILGIKVKDHSDDLSKGFAITVVVMLCTFVSSFAWSWGPLGWVIPIETFPLETRSAGQSVTVGANLLFTFVIAEASLPMLCHFKFGIFLFFSVFVLIMSLFVFLLVPETGNVPIEEMTERVWKKHWFWMRYFDRNDGVGASAADVVTRIDIKILSCLAVPKGSTY